MSVARYFYNFSVGVSTHIVDLYPEYTKESGLTGNEVRYEHQRYNELIKLIKSQLTKEQRSSLERLMKMRSDGIINEEGKYLKP